MAARDYYAEARQIASRLLAEGFAEWANKFDDAIARGFTATEILMALRWEARQLQEARLPLPAAVESQLESFLAGLEEVLA